MFGMARRRIHRQLHRPGRNHVALLLRLRRPLRTILTQLHRTRRIAVAPTVGLLESVHGGRPQRAKLRGNTAGDRDCLTSWLDRPTGRPSREDATPHPTTGFACNRSRPWFRNPCGHHTTENA